MITRLVAMAVTLALVLWALPGCIPAIFGSRQTAEQTKPAAAPDAPSLPVPQESKKLTDEELDKLLPPPPPSYKQPDSRAVQAAPARPLEEAQKAEVTESASRFAKEVPNVKNAKVCFSHEYGGWYLILYVNQGKRIALQHYSWKPASKEWDVVYRDDLTLTPKELEIHLKATLEGESCFRLK